MFQKYLILFSASIHFFLFVFNQVIKSAACPVIIMTSSLFKPVWQQVWTCKAAQEVVLIPAEEGVQLLPFTVNKLVLWKEQKHLQKKVNNTLFFLIFRTFLNKRCSDSEIQIKIFISVWF